MEEAVNRQILTMRFILEKGVLQQLLAEPEFANNLPIEAKCAIADHFLAIFVFQGEWQDNGTVLLKVISTTVLGVQRYTNQRLEKQGVYKISMTDHDNIPLEVLRSHFRAEREDLINRLKSMNGPGLKWTNQFTNGAGDLDEPVGFLIADPEVVELNALFERSSEQATD